MATRISVALKGDAQVGTFDVQFPPEYHNAQYIDAVNAEMKTLSFVDIDGDVFTFRTEEIKAISFVGL